MRVEVALLEQVPECVTRLEICAEVVWSALHGLATGTSGGNGLYLYSQGSAFPTQSFSGSNYWVDVVFAPNLAPDVVPPTVITST